MMVTIGIQTNNFPVRKKNVKKGKVIVSWNEGYFSQIRRAKSFGWISVCVDCSGEQSPHSVGWGESKSFLGDSEADRRTHWGERGGAMALYGKRREAEPCFVYSKKLLGLFLMFIPGFHFL